MREKVESNHFFYRKTEAGELLQQLLKNGRIMNALLRVSGRKLRY
jgi:hypothetical protein